MENYVVYIRVSTAKQGASGLGLEAQRKICEDFIKSNNGEKVAEYKDVESGTHRDRKGLLSAIDYCVRNNCALVIAKLDRLARDVEFCFKVVNTGIKIHFCDMPQINTLLLGVFASVAQYERELTSERTRKALAAKKERGEATGGACDAWKKSFQSKSKEELKKENMKRGKTKNKRYFDSRDVQAFLKVLRNVFPDACIGDVPEWNWDAIGTKNGDRQKTLLLMKDYQELDHTLFVKWDFTQDIDGRELQVKLAAYIKSIKRSVNTLLKFNNM